MIDRVELVDANFRAKVYLAPDLTGVYSIRDKPPILPKHSQPADGYIIPGDGSRFELVVVFPDKRPGRYFFRDVVLHYHVGATHYEAEQRYSALLCARAAHDHHFYADCP